MLRLLLNWIFIDSSSIDRRCWGKGWWGFALADRNYKIIQLVFSFALGNRFMYRESMGLNPTSPLGDRWFRGASFQKSFNPFFPSFHGEGFTSLLPLPVAQDGRGKSPWDPRWRPRALPGVTQKSINVSIDFSTHFGTMLATEMAPKTIKNHPRHQKSLTNQKIQKSMSLSLINVKLVGPCNQIVLNRFQAILNLY